MKIIIDIPEEVKYKVYNYGLSLCPSDKEQLIKAIMNGTPLEQEPCENCCNGNQIEKAKLCQKSYLAGMEHKQETTDEWQNGYDRAWEEAEVFYEKEEPTIPCDLCGFNMDEVCEYLSVCPATGKAVSE